MIDIPGMRAGFLAMGSAAVLLAAPGTSLASASADHADHLKSATHEGHDFVYRLFEPSSASTKAVRSGSWSDPTTWSAGVPAAGGRVLIPRDISVTLDSNAVVPMAWIRIDGALDVAPERDTRHDVTTMMVADGGRLSIGGVRNPIEAARTARIYFSPRRGDHKRSDPADISGGLIVFGKFEAHGAGKTAFAIPADRRGLAPVLSEMAMRGAGDLDSRAQADAFDRLGVNRGLEAGGVYLRLTASLT
ncbi:MAG: G8 domain-containing protein, partial [Parvularculaceae bacterium]